MNCGILKPLSRRRTLAIMASIVALPLTTAAAPTKGMDLYRWSGTALGVEASLTLYHDNAAAAAAIIDTCQAELRRLEAIFSLYDPGSAVSVLNRAGRLDHAPSELIEMIQISDHFSRLSCGAFDITVQSLWTMYSNHFASPDGSADGPSPATLTDTRRCVGYSRVKVDDARVRLLDGATVTFNGIAQGFITDRVSELLQKSGLRHVLVDLGEQRTLDGHADGRPWIIGIPDPRAPNSVLHSLKVTRQAVATSAGYGMVFDAAGRFNHILDPRTGRSPTQWASVTVLADNATTADALTKVLALVPPEQASASLILGGGAGAVLVAGNGNVVTLGSAG